MNFTSLAKEAIANAGLDVLLTEHDGHIGFIGSQEDCRAVLAEMICTLRDDLHCNDDSDDELFEHNARQFTMYVNTIMKFREEEVYSKLYPTATTMIFFPDVLYDGAF